MRDIFFKVIIKSRTNQLDLTPYIIGDFEYEESTEKDNYARFTMALVDTRILDDPMLVANAECEFLFGYYGDARSDPRKGKLVTITPRYGKDIRVQCEIYDYGIDLKRVPNNRVWNGVTATDIVARLAADLGLKVEAAQTTKVYNGLPQANKDAMTFLRELARNEGDGEYIVYVQEDTLIFRRRDYGQASAVAYKYGTADANIISFEAKIAVNPKNKGGSSATVVGVNPNTGQVESHTATPTTSGENELLGGIINFDQYGNEIAGAIENVVTGSSNVPRSVIPAGPDAQQNRSHANAAHKTGADEINKATMEIEGDPLIRPGIVITIGGNVSRKNSGNWYVHTVSHRLGTGYRTRVQLQRNATNSPTTTESRAPAPPPVAGIAGQSLFDSAYNVIFNTESGPQQQDTRRQLDRINFDQNGNRIN